MSTFNSADIAAFNGGVWVFCEQRQGSMMPTSFELISEGRKLADELGTKLYGILLATTSRASPRSWAATAPTACTSATTPCWSTTPPTATPRSSAT